MDLNVLVVIEQDWYIWNGCEISYPVEYMKMLRHLFLKSNIAMTQPKTPKNIFLVTKSAASTLQIAFMLKYTI